MKSREETLDELLRPIKWPWSTSIEWRRSLVQLRHAEVRLVMPFLTDDEQNRAKEWLAREAHKGLWD